MKILNANAVNIFIVIFVILGQSYIANASPEQYAEQLTKAIQQCDSTWNDIKTKEMLNNLKKTGNGKYENVFAADKCMVIIQIMGDTILVNGKDITGNLGSKITSGNNSPIIENVQNSNVVVGDNNTINSQYQVLNEKLSNFKNDILQNSQIKTQDRNDVISDIDTIQAQLQKEKPSINIVQEAWDGIKKIADGYGYAKVIFEIGKLIAGLL